MEPAFREFIEGEGRDLPLPGSGRTWRRFEALADAAALDLSLARLAEGHADARAILAEAGVGNHHDEASYGVWAARSSSCATIATRVRRGWRISGYKEFCSGAGLLDRALVVAEASDGYRLFDVALGAGAISRNPDSWQAVGMADSVSETLRFDDAFVGEADAVEGPGFYLQRPGFWFGASGVAACWFGGAAGLVRWLVGTLGPDIGEHRLAELGRAVALVGSMRRVLAGSAEDIDADPDDQLGEARPRALALRQIVHDGCTEILTLATSAGGARPLCHDRSQARRAADLLVYLSQHHGASDASEIGRLALEGWSWS